VEERGSTLRVFVSDDGAGGPDPGRGSGLTGLRDRAEATGGSIEVTSPRGDGTLGQVSLPIQPEDGAERAGEDTAPPQGADVGVE
jgi:signal transduction histidine kinase